MEVKCDLIKDLLPLYIEGLCSETSKKTVDEHITNCQSCNNLLTGLTNQNEITINKNAVKKSIKPFKKVKRRNFIITASVVICTIIIISAFYCKLFIIGSTAPTSEVTITNFEMIDALTFKIELELSSDSDIKVINNIGIGERDNSGNVYVRVNQVFISPSNPKAYYTTTFGFDEDAFEGYRIKGVYLIGNDKNDIKLIWQDS